MLFELLSQKKLSMKPIIKICPTCKNEFQAERKNKTYCSDTCRAEVNNEKQRQKIKSLKSLEIKSALGDKYKAAYLSSIRIVQITYNSEKDGDFVTFEGQRFEYHSTNAETLENLGIGFNGNSVKDGSYQKTAIYIPSERVLCFKTSYRSTFPFVFKMI